MDQATRIYRIMIADDLLSQRRQIRSILRDLEDEGLQVDFFEADTTSALDAHLFTDDFDLVTLDISFTEERAGREGLDALPAIVRHQPRVPVVLVSAQLDLDFLAEAMRGRNQVLGGVNKGSVDFRNKLLDYARKSLAWRDDQQRLAEAIFERALQAKAVGNAVDTAAKLLEAYQTHDLPMELHRRLPGELAEVLPQLESHPLLQRDVLEALVHAHANLHDAVGAVRWANAMRVRFPDDALSALEMIALASHVDNDLYRMVDARLERSAIFVERGEWPAVIKECDEIDSALGNVLPSLLLRSDALMRVGNSYEADKTLLEAAWSHRRNGELSDARRLLETVLSRTEHAKIAEDARRIMGEVIKVEDDIADLRDKYRADPVLNICGRPECLTLARESGSIFWVDTSRSLDACDICAVERQKAVSQLQGRVIGIVGGRFGPKYRDTLLRLGADEVLHHDAIHQLHRIPDLISHADGVLIVTRYASHAGTIKAEAELQKQEPPKPSSRVHFYGLVQVVNAVLRDLLPKMTDCAR